MSFLLADCKELDFGELLAVNGGCAGGGSCSGGYSGGGGGYSSSGPSSSSGGCNGSPRVSSPSGCNGSFSPVTKPAARNDCSGGTNNPVDVNKLINEYNDPENVKKREDANRRWQEKYGDTGEPNDNPSDVTEKEEDDTASSVADNKEDENVTKIKTAIDNYGDDSAGKGEKKFAYKVGEFQCDDYVEKILTDAGFDPKDYYVDSPSAKTVDTHISELKAAGSDKYSTDVSGLSDGAYVVFMADANGNLGSHAALLVVDSEGGSYMYDNSSHNFPGRDSEGNIIRDKDGNIVSFDGGIERTGTVGSTPKKICDQYVGYENFYFQKIN